MEYLGSVLEKSTAKVTVTFTDCSGVQVAPKTATWKLTDEFGTIIATGSISPLAAVSTVILSGSDLAITSSLSLERIFLVEGTYDEATKPDATLKGQAKFRIEDLKAVS